MNNFPTMAWEHITPHAAKMMLLTRYEKQRVINHGHVAYLKNQLESGLFDLNSDCVVVDVNGHLINGQHRLTAIADADVAAWLPVMRGAPTDMYMRIDQRLRAKSLGDALTFCGESNAKALAAILSLLIQWDSGLRSFRPGSLGQRGSGSARYLAKPSAADLMRALEKRPFARDAANYVASHSRRIPYTPSSVGLVYVLANEINPDLADQYVSGLANELDVPTSDARRVVRGAGVGWRLKNIRKDHAEEIAILIKGWNAFSHGRPMAMARWGSQEAFPKLEA